MVFLGTPHRKRFGVLAANSVTHSDSSSGIARGRAVRGVQSSGHQKLRRAVNLVAFTDVVTIIFVTGPRE